MRAANNQCLIPYGYGFGRALLDRAGGGACVQRSGDKLKIMKMRQIPFFPGAGRRSKAVALAGPVGAQRAGGRIKAFAMSALVAVVCNSKGLSEGLEGS